MRQLAALAAGPAQCASQQLEPSPRRQAAARHQPQQHAPSSCLGGRRQVLARAAAPAAASQAAAAPAAAAATPAASATQPLLCDRLQAVLQQACAASSLSADQLTREQQERIINMGSAIRALQKDLPAMLEREPELSIYCDGVLFEDNLSPRLGLPAASCAGREAYKRLCWSLRFHRTLFFRQAKVEVQRMWEREPGVVCVRWSARAAPRLGDLVAAAAAGAAHMTLDGVSEFHFNDRGHIMKHAVDCVSYSGMQLAGAKLLERMRAQQRALVPGLAGGSFDEC